jgi:PAS domain S-box-containing protein
VTLGEPVQHASSNIVPEQEVAALRRVVHALATHLNEARVFWLVVRSASTLLDAPYARLWLLDGGQTLRCTAAEGYLEPDPIGRCVESGGLPGLSLRTGPVNLGDVTAHPLWTRSSAPVRLRLERDGLRAYLAVPIQRAGRPLGVLELMRASGFRHDDEHLASTLADAAAVAVGNARTLDRADALMGELAASELRYRSLLEHTSSGVFSVDLQGRFVACNAGWERTSGYREEELVGAAFAARLGPPEPLEMLEAVHHALDGEPREWQGVIARRDGRSIEVRGRIFPTFVDGRVAGAHAIVDDVTQSQQREKAEHMRLRQQAVTVNLGQWAVAGAEPAALMQAVASRVADTLEAQFATIWELPSGAQWLEERVVIGLPTVAGGGQREPLASDSQLSYTLSQHEPVIVDDLQLEARFVPSPRLLELGARSAASVAFGRPDQRSGALCVFALRPRAFSELATEFLHTVANILGMVTARGRAEDAAYRLSRELEPLVELAPDAIVRFDRDLRHQYVNPAAERMAGLSSDQLLGRTHRDVGATDAVATTWETRLQQVFRTGREQVFELRPATPGGEPVHEVRLAPEAARDGSVECVLAVARDITERKRADAERAEQHKALVAREAELRQLLERVVGEREGEQRRAAQVAELEKLTPRERDILRLVIEGQTNAKIGKLLGLSTGTAKNHISRILTKLGAVDRTQAAARAVDLGLIGEREK